MSKKHTEETKKEERKTPNGTASKDPGVETIIKEPASPAVETGPANEAEHRIAQLEEELKAALESKEEYYNRMLRTQADFENFRRRSRQEYEQITCFAGEELLKKILPVLDSLERAVDSFSEQSDNSSWQEGVSLTLKQFQAILKSEGLEQIATLQQAFDPQVHEALLQEKSDQVTCPTVIEELQKGYKYKGKLLRPALVKVAVAKVE
ncbi:MAG: nucleotide exchange factor GrpE [Bacillota bacterium]